MSECTHDCSTCGENCSSRQQEIPKLEQNPGSKVKKVIGVVSGKGGVGKSIVTSMLAVLTNRYGYKTAILDADITGPSIPKAFNVKSTVAADENSLLPAESKMGVKIMSINLLLENEGEPVVWRGPVISGVVGQFWKDVVWGDVDFMYVDMPPGTGDVALTVFQQLPIDGIVVVTTPQDLVSMVVEKAINMANMMNIPILGLVENMSYIECPDCHKKIYMFGEGKTEETAKKLGIPLLAKIPMNPNLAKNVDKGVIELFEGDFLDEAVNTITKE